MLSSARFGKNADSLLIMTSDGVTELSFTNRMDPPARQQIIQQETVIPESLDEKFVTYFPFCAETGTEWSLLLVPVAGGLQVWQHHDGWHQAQFIERAVETHLHPSIANAGYTRSFDLSLSLGDVNGDARDDLIVMRNSAAGAQIYSLYLQNAAGRFVLEPALTYTNKADWHVGLAWADIDRDGKADLIKSTFLDEPFFVPGMRSGKVVVGAYLADARGHIPSEPQHVFRKNDWSSALPVVDVDGDGFVDLVMGHIPISSREGFRKAVTAQEVDFTLKFYFFRPGAGFSKDPDYERDLLVHFSNEFFFTENRRLYYEQFISLNGDFNGDGKKDLLVRDRGSEISVYFFISREKGFSREPDLRFKCPEPIDSWEVKDLNGDGVSDLIVKLRERNGSRIFISQKK